MAWAPRPHRDHFMVSWEGIFSATFASSMTVAKAIAISSPCLRHPSRRIITAPIHPTGRRESHKGKRGRRIAASLPLRFSAQQFPSLPSNYRISQRHLAILGQSPSTRWRRRALPADFVGTRDPSQPALALAAFGRDPSRLRQSAGGHGEAARSAGEAGRVAGAESKANPFRVPISSIDLGRE